MDSSEKPPGGVSPREGSGGTLGRLIRGLGRTRDGLVERIKSLVQAPSRIDAGLLDQVEALLLLSDVGPSLTSEVIQALKQKASGREIRNWSELVELVRGEMKQILSGTRREEPLTPAEAPEVVLMVGVNGGGKTTTAG